MITYSPELSTPLDLPTMLVMATWMAALLGLFLFLAWIGDRAIRALAWWSTAYIIGGSAIALWGPFRGTSPHLLEEIPSALLFFSAGMIWTGARLFQGRGVRPLWLSAGALVWLVASQFISSGDSEGRLVLSSLIISAYAFLSAAELWRERRARSFPRWQVRLMPLLHAAVFLSPVILPELMPRQTDTDGADRWLLVLTIETVLYAVGTAFLILALVQERRIRFHKDAASTDALTGVRNRRAFLDDGQKLIARCAKARQPVTVLMFDLDHFKKINDRFGHAIGDEALKLFARTASAGMRGDDVIGRLGGEEFAAIVPGQGTVASGIAERIRSAFENAGRTVAGHPLGATVSIGATWTHGEIPIDVLLGRADAALYRAKAKGRNRLEIVDGDVRVDGESRTPGSANGSGQETVAYPV